VHSDLGMTVCPVDCAPCGDPSCAGACRKSGEARLVACESCGEVTLAVRRIAFCGACTVRIAWRNDVATPVVE